MHYPPDLLQLGEGGKVPKAKRDPMNGYRYWTMKDLRKLKKRTGRQ